MWIILLHVLIVVGCTARILLRENMPAPSRLAWFIVIVLFPVAGGIAYFLFGEIKTGQTLERQHELITEKLKEIGEREHIPQISGNASHIDTLIAEPYQSPFRYLSAVQGVYPVTGNAAELMPDGDTARSRLLQDIHDARLEVNLLYYIWLNDATGTRMAEALISAAQRGVKCRVMVDGLGSRAFIRSKLWADMISAGVDAQVTLSIRNPLKVILTSRIDLRNHRKLTIIDGAVTHIGSQNCADEAFAVKAKYAPWVDIMVRFEGAIAAQNNVLFASCWYAATGEVLDPIRPPKVDGQCPALIMGDGPTGGRKMTPQLLVTITNTARRELTLTTPYFIPDESTLEALCAAAMRGVRVTMILPKNNDSWVVAGASRSHYLRLLHCGVNIHEYRPGLLHAKILVVDRQLTFIGSSNFDLRSFDLNFENNVLLQDEALSQAILVRQQEYLSESDAVTLRQVQSWSYPKRMWNNLLSTIGPLL